MKNSRFSFLCMLTLTILCPFVAGIAQDEEISPQPVYVGVSQEESTIPSVCFYSLVPNKTPFIEELKVVSKKVYVAEEPTGYRVTVRGTVSYANIDTKLVDAYYCSLVHINPIPDSHHLKSRKFRKFEPIAKLPRSKYRRSKKEGIVVSREEGEEISSERLKMSFNCVPSQPKGFIFVLDVNGEEEIVVGEMRRTVEQPNVMLFVSNQNFKLNPVDIKIMIDDKVVVDQDFDVVNQHNWLSFPLQLAEGKHEVTISSQKAKATMKKILNVNKNRWVVVDYLWDNPKRKNKFSYFVSDKRIGFK